MTVRDSHYRAKQPFRARGLRDLARLVGGIEDDIERRLGRAQPVRILEIGCGYGTALLELAARYGPGVALHGINRHAHDGDSTILERNARERGLEGALTQPSLHFADVAGGLPFADDSFDIVYSQVAWMYFGNKLGVLKDVVRVLAADGVARIDADELRSSLPAEYARLVEIWERGSLVTFGDYLQRHGAELAAAPEGEYARLSKRSGFADDVELVLELDLSRVHADWDGVKCVYRITT